MRKLADKMIEKISSPMQTPANKAEPKMSIKVSRAKTTIMDSDYWTVETIRSKAGLGDVSVAPRRFKPYGSPNRIYEIHVDNGVVGTAIREYPDTFKGGWKDQFTLGPGSSVSVAFDGYWEKYRGLWRLVTTEKPWISWVDNSGILWSQLWDDESTSRQLATDVKHVRMLRAWKNKVIRQNDQGVVVAYIKNDGTVFYRSYCQQEDYSYLWENETALVDFTATAVSLNLFITNDYRMGFILEDSTGNIHWLVTTRNWGGMASPSDNVAVSINEIMFDVIPIKYYEVNDPENLNIGLMDLSFIVLYGASYYSIVEVENVPVEMINEETTEIYQDWGYKLKVRFNHDFSAISPADFALTDSNNIQYGIQEINKINATQYEFTTVNFNNAMGSLLLQYNPDWATRGEAGQEIEAFSKSVDPVNLVPVDLPIPKAVNIWNE